MARSSGQWGGEQHRDYLRRLQAERRQGPGCLEVAAGAVAAVIAAGLLAYGCVRAGGWLI